MQIYKERKNLAYTLQDARGVVSKLELIMGVMMHVLFVFFYLIIFDVSLLSAWCPADYYSAVGRVSAQRYCHCRLHTQCTGPVQQPRLCMIAIKLLQR